MDFSLKCGNPEKQRSGCIVVGVHETRQLTPAAEALDMASDGHIGQIVRKGDIDGKQGQTLMLHRVPGIAAERVLLMGCGKAGETTPQQYLKICTEAAQALDACGATEACSYLPEVQIRDHDLLWRLRMVAQASETATYRFDSLKSKKDKRRHPLRKMTVCLIGRRQPSGGREAMQTGESVAHGVNLARNLANLPANLCTPSHLAERATALRQDHPGLKVTILNESKMKKLGMGSFLSVAQGSAEPAKLIVIEHRGGPKNQRPVALVGKGVTFDSGGISIKPGAGMDEMKFDMCGAASVFGALQACAELHLPLNVIGIVPATENLPDGKAVKPGDVVTSLSGQTIEILNTDAEGRLILCDAITYARRYDPVSVIDIATLTGACVIALGKHPHGLFSNSDALAKDLLAAGQTAQDRAWQLPIWEEYQDQLKSNFADMANIGGRDAGAVTAACFLARFAHDLEWAHLDIAGTAWLGGDQKGATGRPVPLLVQYLLDRPERS